MLLIRTLTGAGVVGLVLGAVWLGAWPAAALFLLISLLGQLELYNLFEKKGIKPQKVTGIIISAVWYVVIVLVMWGYVSTYWLMLLPLSFIVTCIMRLIQSDDASHAQPGQMLFSFFYVPALLALTIASLYLNGNYNPILLTGMLVVLWLYDTGAYLSGSAFGRTPLFKRISPKKTVEGLVGGALLALLIAMLWAGFFDNGNYVFWAVAWFLIVASGTFGDLFESFIKRDAGVKDSGSLLPGHGGVLDRFDALLFAGPVYCAWVVYFIA